MVVDNTLAYGIGMSDPTVLRRQAAHGTSTPNQPQAADKPHIPLAGAVQKAASAQAATLTQTKGQEQQDIRPKQANGTGTPAAAAADASAAPVERKRRLFKRPKAKAREFTLSLASVLNDPNRDRQQNLFTEDWGDDFLPSPLPPHANEKVVTMKDFEQFKLKHGEAAKQVKRNVAWFAQTEKHRRSSADENANLATSGAAANVPRMFFSPDFRLDHPRIFSTVYPEESIDRSSALLQEKLTHYLDLVEMQLVSEISKRSEKFFDIVVSQEELNDAVYNTCETIASLRASLNYFKSVAGEANLKVINLVQQRKQYSAMMQKLKTVSLVANAQPTIQLLLAGNDYLGALDLIGSAKDVLHSELTGIVSLRHTGAQLNEVQDSVLTLMENEVTQTFISLTTVACSSSDGAPDITSPSPEQGDFSLTLVPTITQVHAVTVTSETLASTNETAFEEADQETIDDRFERLVPIFFGLLRHSRIQFVHQYRREIIQFIKNLIRETVVDYFAPAEQEKASDPNASYADFMRSLGFHQWLSLLALIYRKLLAVLVITRSIQAKIMDVLQAMLPTQFAQAHKVLSSSNISQSSRLPMVPEGPAEADHLTESDNVIPVSAAADSHGLPPAKLLAPDTGLALSSHDIQPVGARLPSNRDDDTADFVDLHDEPDYDNPSGSDLLAALDGVTTTHSFAQGTGNIRASSHNDLGTTTSAETAGTTTTTTTTATATTPTSTANSEDSPFRSPTATDASVEAPKTDDNRGRRRLTSGGESEDLSLAQPLFTTMVATSQKIILDCCEESHIRCSKLLTARNKDGIDDKLAMSSFSQFYRLSMEFVEKSEQIAAYSTPTLRSCVLLQGRRFLDRFHARQKEKIELTLANERWEPATVPKESQAIVNELVPSKLVPPSDEPSMYLVVGGDYIRPIGALLLFVHSIAEYMQCIHEMPALAMDVATRLADSIRHFNIQLNKLILKAEAIKTCNLRTITAKHLALSSQALSAVIALLPFLRDSLGKALPDNMQIRLNEFGSVETDLLGHRREIFEKLVSMMTDVWARSAKDFLWGKESPTLGAKGVVDRTTKLHTALSGILSLSDIKTVFRDILGVYNRRLIEATAQKDRREKASMAADVVFMEEQLGKLDSVPMATLRSGLPELGLVLPSLIMPHSST